MELRPCPACRRHVDVDERACPFCAVGLAPVRAQFATPSRLTRAAIFSAALVACGDKAPPPPPGGSATPTTIVDAATTTIVDAAAARAIDAAPLAPVADGGTAETVPDDAKPSDEELRNQRLERLQRALERRRQRTPPPVQMPYGAPPARRRVV